MTAILLGERTNALDLVAPFQALALARETTADGEAAYDLIVTSLHGGLVRMASGLAVETRPLSALDDADLDTIIVPGRLAIDQASMARVASWLRLRAPNARRTCALGAGTLLLAEIGLLAGRKACTHWNSFDILRAGYSGVEAMADRILVSDGGYWTSGGMASGLDLALALIHEDLGRSAALTVAKLLLVFMLRQPDHSQISQSLKAQLRGGLRFAALHDWIARNLDADLRVDALAERMGMTPRTFARIYRRETGVSPARAVEAIRLEFARAEFMVPGVLAKSVAARCGFGSELNLRRAYDRHFGHGPSDDRKRSRQADRTEQQLPC